MAKKIEADNPELYKLYGRINNNIIEHGQAAGTMWQRSEQVHRNHRIRFDPMTFLFSWRNRRQLASVMARAASALTAPVEEAPRIEEWRSSTVKNEKIVRATMALLNEKRSVTVAEVLEKCVNNFKTTRETVRNCLNLGVELKVLEKRNEQYEVSEILSQEITDRVSIKMCDRDVVEMAEIVNAYNLMREFMFKTYGLERDARLPQDSPASIHEQIHKRGLEDDGSYGFD
jgi:hypothetical protein